LTSRLLGHDEWFAGQAVRERGLFVIRDQSKLLTVLDWTDFGADHGPRAGGESSLTRGFGTSAVG
jgi:hypothetical protein